MKWFYKLQYKYGRYAIPNLMRYMVILYLAGLVLVLMDGGAFYVNYLSLNPAAILKGQVWRLFTFLLYPAGGADIFMGLLSCYIYWNLGTAVERAWGAFKFNVYIFGGIFGTVLAAFIVYLIAGDAVLPQIVYTNTEYLNFSLFMAFAFTYPNTQFLFMFLIPIKAVVFGWIELILYVVLFITGSVVTKVMIGISLLNFIVFFLLTRNLHRFSPKEVKRRADFKRAAKTVPRQVRHRCAVCGKTEKDGEDLEFRYCSKCAGDFEYCKEHLFTHIHVTPEALEQMKKNAGK